MNFVDVRCWAVVGGTALAVLGIACGTPSGEEDCPTSELSDVQERAEAIYHFGCEPDDCQYQENLVCGESSRSRLEERLRAGEKATAQQTLESVRGGYPERYWVVRPDGSGTFFRNSVGSDVAGEGPSCRTHREEFDPIARTGEEAVELRTPDGWLTLEELQGKTEACS